MFQAGGYRLHHCSELRISCRADCARFLLLAVQQGHRFPARTWYTNHADLYQYVPLYRVSNDGRSVFSGDWEARTGFNFESFTADSFFHSVTVAFAYAV